MYIDDPELRKLTGVSDLLTEHTQCEGVAYNDFSEYNWSFYVHPPTEINDLIYFQIYDNAYDNGPVCVNASKIARISMTDAKYVRCTDTSIPEWFLSDDEVDHLLELLNNNDRWLWGVLKRSFIREREGFDGVILDIENLHMPNYSKLKNIE